jgi:hypothetical protein
VTTPPHEWVAGQAGGGWPGKPAGANAFSQSVIINPNESAIANYVNKSPGIFQCPSDPRLGPAPAGDINAGQLVRAARSVSMNQGVGSICAAYNNPSGGCPGSPHPANNPPIFPVNGPWLEGGGGCNGPNKHDNPWATFGKTTDFHTVGPSQIFMTTDENYFSINDAALAICANTAEWVDWPADYHANSGCFSFCDGHGELHKWITGTLFLNAEATLYPLTKSNEADWLWLAMHATHNVTSGTPF